MTTCAAIHEQLDSGKWTALDAAHGMILSAMDDYVEGVSLSLKDPEFWKLCGHLMEKAGEAAIKVARMIAIVVGLLAK
jgi:hypothetical protein